MTKQIGLALVFLLSLTAGCVTPKKTWTSTPVLQRAGNPAYEVRLEPLKDGNRFYVAFRLTLINKTEKTLEIDWNKTRYMYEGRASGGFVFGGIDPETVKDAIPPDLVPGGGTFSKEISPTKLIAYVPLAERSLEGGKKGIYPGPIPEGENGVFLVVRQNGKEISENITVYLKEKEAL